MFKSTTTHNFTWLRAMNWNSGGENKKSAYYRFWCYVKIRTSNLTLFGCEFVLCWPLVFEMSRTRSPVIVILLLVSLSVHARVGVEYQMALGNPSGATSDSNNHSHYLTQRRVFAMDYDDSEGEPNWVSWDLTAEDIGHVKRSPFHADTELPVNFYHVKDGDYVRSGFDRGHMCPSADRTANAAENDMVFTMANIIPQMADNNQGVWEQLESDCRELAKAGNELLIICGPAEFRGTRINGNGPVFVPQRTWKIVVVVPAGNGPVLNRINPSTRVIAVDIPNIAGIRHDPWQKYLVSVSQLEKLTGFKFFTALKPELAAVLKSKVDGQATTVATVEEPVPTSATTATPASADWITIGIVVLSLLLVLSIAVLVLFFRTRPKAK